MFLSRPHTWLFFLLLILRQVEYFGKKDTLAVRYDSAAVKLYSPTPASEQKIFSDPKLNYDDHLVERKGFMDKLLDWLAEKLFGSAGYDNIETARAIVTWTVVVLVVILVIYLLWRSEMVSLIRARPKATSFHFGDITEELNTINFDQRIKEALDSGDLRLAIRWHYLKVLYLLDRSGIIAFSPFKTNIDYGNEMGAKEFSGDFKKLSRVYDYVWYGKFDVNRQDYDQRADQFHSFEKKVNV